MPYSLSHAVVAIPVGQLTKGKVPTMAVVLGAVSPDFPYLLVLAPTHAPGHSILGVFIYCIVPCLAVLFVWYRWLENPTLSLWHLPKRELAIGRGSIPFIILGVLIGALSHVLWDSTSHSYGTIVQGSTLWKTEVFSLPIFKWNQYVSGVLGLVLLGIWYLYSFFKYFNAPYTGYFKSGVFIYTICIAGIVALGSIVHQPNSFAAFAVTTSIGVMSGGVLAVALYGALYQVRDSA